MITFGVFTALARLLTPQVFGLVAIAGVYLSFLQVFVDQGFGSAVIQRKELEKEHIDSVFWIAVATAAALCLLSVLLAGQVARLFHEPKVAPVIGWLSLSLLFYALCATPTAVLTRELKFRTLTLRSLIPSSIGGAVGIAMAFLGFGVWSLVGQQLLTAALECVCLWWAVEWRPSLHISMRHLRDLYGFSLKVTGNNVLWFFTQRSDQTFVGYAFGSEGLGPYSLASKLGYLLVYAIVQPLQAVGFPALSKLQSEPERMERAVRKFCEVSSFISFPVFSGLAVVAPELVPTVFGRQWGAAVPILRLLAVYFCLRAMFAFLDPLMLSAGRSGTYLAMYIFDSCLTFACCWCATRWSPSAVAFSLIVSISIFSVLSFAVVARLFRWSAAALLKPFLFPAASSLVMVLVVAAARHMIVNSLRPATTLAVCIAVGATVYLLAAFYGNPSLLHEVWSAIGLEEMWARDSTGRRLFLRLRGGQAPAVDKR